jgi:hypothetical protein
MRYKFQVKACYRWTERTHMARRITAKPRLMLSMSRRRESDGPVAAPAPFALLVSMEAKKAVGMVNAKTLSGL